MKIIDNEKIYWNYICLEEKQGVGTGLINAEISTAKYNQVISGCRWK